MRNYTIRQQLTEERLNLKMGMGTTINKCIICFVKYPGELSVKSRLARVLGKTIAHQFYECFVLDMLEVIIKSRYPFVICFTPQSAAKETSRWLGEQYHYIPQRGNDLGTRMKNAFLDVFEKGGEETVLIGSDIPGITAPMIRTAFRKLKTADCVVGPAEDGGYYLIGLRRESFSPDIFKGIHWGSRSVLTETIHRIGKHSYSLMPVMRDIDTFNDLRAFFNAARGSQLESTRTFALLSRVRNLPLNDIRDKTETHDFS